jgi:2-polyprenyl-3-methyl-5-hydroxy-6-metoxy-1,4-benzoquinol methylase
MPKSHLDYYNKHGISPVHYIATSVQEHFERRASLYRSLGLPPLAFRGARVLEVAVGSGQNSLYVASRMPASLTLVEPNPTGINEIRELYAKTLVPHTSPMLVEMTLQDYTPEHQFDIVLCENWLGRVPHERALLRKLAGFVAPDGIMVVTTLTPTGFLPNLIRRALSVKYCDPRLPFADRTARLVEMFAPHLAHMSAMTRTATDWVQDNMMNPAYFDICLTIPDILQEVGEGLNALGTNPSFSTDWRWFKAVCGEAREFNGHMIDEYEAQLHNFFDYQLEFSQTDVQLNRKIEAACIEFLEAARSYEHAVLTDQHPAEALDKVTGILKTIIARMYAFPDQVRLGLEAGLALLQAEHADFREVAKNSPFSRLFGRETVYLSLINDKCEDQLYAREQQG